MDHSLELLHQAFAVFIFCIAVTILFISYHNYITVINTRKEAQKESIIYEQPVESKNYIVKRADLMTMLFHDLEYDIEVEGVLINKSENVIEKITTYHFNKNEYKKSYVYDNKGNILKIVFE